MPTFSFEDALACFYEAMRQESISISKRHWSRAARYQKVQRAFIRLMRENLGDC